MNGTEVIPQSWLWVSGIFFGLGIVFLIGLTFALLKVIQMLSALQPKVVALEASVQSLVEKVHNIAENVEDLTQTVKTTVADVSGNAKIVAGNAQLVSTTAAREFERYSPLVMGALTAFKVIRAIGEIRSHNKVQAEVETTKKKAKSKIGMIFSVASHLLGK